MNLDDQTVCKYLTLIRQAERQALKDPESAANTFKKAHSFIDKTINDTNKMMFRGLEDVNMAIEKLRKLIDSDGSKFKQLLFSKELKSPFIEVYPDQRSAKRF